MLLSNPLAHPLLPPLALTLSGLLTGALAALLIVARGHLRHLGESVLFVRWRTWLVIAPLVTLVVLAGPLAVALFAAALAFQGAREYATLVGLPTPDRWVLQVVALLAPVVTLLVPTSLLPSGVLALGLVATLPALLHQDVAHGTERTARLAFGLLYVPVALCLLVVLSVHPRGGPGLLLGVLLAVGLADVGAFTLGRLLGRRPLAPRLSPAKTRAGVLGSVAGAAAGLGLLAPLLPPALPLAPLALATGLGAVWGDLLESLLKRGAGVKDSGRWLPGFGGLLDRIDSLLITLPLVLVVVEVIP